MVKVNRPIRIVHIAQYATPILPDLAVVNWAIHFTHIADLLTPYRRFAIIISPICYIHIADLLLIFFENVIILLA